MTYKVKIESQIVNYTFWEGDNLLIYLAKNGRKDCKQLFIIDKKVNKQCSDEELAAISENNYFYYVVGGEKLKSEKEFFKLINKLLELNFTKYDTLIAVGGGTVTDLVGFVASVYKRGLHLINVPTTTLGMIDAAIGGKNALNFNNVKNVLGTIFHPNHIYIDVTYLVALPDKVYFDGLVEALKLQLLFMKKTFEELTENLIEDFLSSSLQKLYVVADDANNKRFRGVRNLLNFGHTIGHAIEGFCFDNKIKMSHGRAVLTGISYMITDVVLRKKVISFAQETYGISIFNDFEIVDLYKYINQDKKRGPNSEIQLIFINNVGSPEVAFWSIEKLFDYMEEVRLCL
jgi:3-dehydroquinate synthase